jgi:hypothetical protein
VEAYSNAAESGGLFEANETIDGARILREIDAAIIKSYELPKTLEKKLLDYFNEAAPERPVSIAMDAYSQSELNEIHASIESDLEPAGVGPAESWDRLKNALDENRLSSRKLFS